MQLGEQLTNVIKVQMAKRGSNDCKRQGWKLQQIPRKSALEKAGHAELYRQLQAFYTRSRGA